MHKMSDPVFWEKYEKIPILLSSAEITPGSALFAYAILSETLVYKILGI